MLSSIISKHHIFAQQTSPIQPSSSKTMSFSTSFSSSSSSVDTESVSSSSGSTSCLDESSSSPSTEHLPIAVELCHCPTSRIDNNKRRNEGHPLLSSGQHYFSKEKLVEMMSQLSQEEMETAARASYPYLVAAQQQLQHRHSSRSNSGSTDSIPPHIATVEETKIYAKRMAQRYLGSKKGNVELALEKMKATLKFRKDMNLEGLITCFDDNDNTQLPQLEDNDNDREIAAANDETLARKLQARLEYKHYYVQGYDKEGRATFIFRPLLAPQHDIEWNLKEALYTMERAIACTKATDGTINAIVDLKNFKLHDAPPLDIGKQFMLTLRNHYAGQIHQIFMIDSPTSFRWVWKIFQGFVGTKTRQKIKFVGGRNKQSVLSEQYDVSEVPSWLLPNDGMIPKNDDLNVKLYLHETPFDRPYYYDKGQSQ